LKNVNIERLGVKLSAKEVVQNNNSGVVGRAGIDEQLKEEAKRDLR
jgi:hypothetical protein